MPSAGLPAVMLTDGPHGLRKQSGDADHLGLHDSEPATCFPPAVAMASTWDPDILERVGEALGTEALASGVGVVLGPGINIKRSPLCGRNFEYFSEDPLLTGVLASALVRGVQSRGVGTSVKHFAANNQETDRMRRDSIVDERTLREIYLRAFATVVRSVQPWTVMCSYNRLNGTPAAENRWLLTDVLRGEWGFEGLVVSDWGAVRDRAASLAAGLDLQMPGDHGRGVVRVEQALESGELSAEALDEAGRRVEHLLRRVRDARVDAPNSFDADAHHAVAREAASEAIVLLTNDGVLPLARETDVAVIGEFARTPRYQGAGSSHVNPTRLDTALDAVAALTGRDVAFEPGFTTASGQTLPESAHEDAVALAGRADVVLLFLGLGENHESEGYDRTTLDLPAEQLALLDDVLAVNENVVVVLSNGASVVVPFAGRVRAVVEGWLLGQAGGAALVDVLYGVVNPSGRLAETIPHRLADVPSTPHFPGDAAGVRYGEGLFVGYRGYDAAERDVAFAFGHGLSYTTFAYDTPTATADEAGVTVRVRVTNTGDRAGREVVQAYVSVPDSRVVRPPRELKGFASVVLEPGASAQVEIVLQRDDLTHWSDLDGCWVLEAGRRVVEVGASSRDIRGTVEVEVTGDEPARPLTLDSSLDEIREVPAVARAIGEVIDGFLGALDDPDHRRMMSAMPVYSLADFSGTPTQRIQDALDEANREAGV